MGKRAGWDAEKVIRQEGIEWTAPTRGSHFKAASPFIKAHQTVPAHRPIKSVYIKKLLGMVLEHRRRKGARDE